MYSSTLSLASARKKTVQVPINRAEITSYFNSVQMVYSKKNMEFLYDNPW